MQDQYNGKIYAASDKNVNVLMMKALFWPYLLELIVNNYEKYVLNILRLSNWHAIC